MHKIVALLVISVTLATAFSLKDAAHPYISGGDIAEQSQFPFAVGLITHQPDKDIICGGTLISANFILTAASCFHGIFSAYAVIGGSEIFNEGQEGQVRMLVNNWIIYRQWNPSQPDINNMALVKLPQAVEMNSYIATIKLPTRAMATNVFANVIGTYIGWGGTQEDEEGSKDLRYADARTLTNASCKLRVKEFEIVESHICTGIGYTGSACAGDEGGPLLTQLDGETIQIGVLTYTPGCHFNNPALVFTRTIEFLDWIEEFSDVQIE